MHLVYVLVDGLVSLLVHELVFALIDVLVLIFVQILQDGYLLVEAIVCQATFSACKTALSEMKNLSSVNLGRAAVYYSESVTGMRGSWTYSVDENGRLNSANFRLPKLSSHFCNQSKICLFEMIEQVEFKSKFTDLRISRLSVWILVLSSVPAAGFENHILPCCMPVENLQYYYMICFWPKDFVLKR